MNEGLTSIERKVQPIAQMSETVRLCKDNINVALDQINKVTANIGEQEDIVDILVDRRTMINSEFDTYIKSMQRAKELIKYFEEDLVYFKDSYTITEKLKVALKTAVEECDRYLEANIKKLLDVTSKKHIKRFKELLKILESCTTDVEFRRYLKFYITMRTGTFKSRLGSSSALDKSVDLSIDGESTGQRMSIIAGSSSHSYERGSHQAIGQVQVIATCIEEELLIAQQVFDQQGGTLGGFSSLSIAVKVCEQLISKLAALLGQCEKEICRVCDMATEEDSERNIKPFIIALDVVETLHETMPKSFLQLIKVKELPLKKAIEGILFKSQTLLLTYSKLQAETDDEDDLTGIQTRLFKVQNFNLNSSVASSNDLRSVSLSKNIQND